MKATEERGKITTPWPVVSVTKTKANRVSLYLLGIQGEKQYFFCMNYNCTSHFVALPHKSMNLAFFQRFVEYYWPTGKKPVRHRIEILSPSSTSCRSRGPTGRSKGPEGGPTKVRTVSDSKRNSTSTMSTVRCQFRIRQRSSCIHR